MAPRMRGADDSRSLLDDRGPTTRSFADLIEYGIAGIVGNQRMRQAANR